MSRDSHFLRTSPVATRCSEIRADLREGAGSAALLSSKEQDLHIASLPCAKNYQFQSCLLDSTYLDVSFRIARVKGASGRGRCISALKSGSTLYIPVLGLLFLEGWN